MFVYEHRTEDTESNNERFKDVLCYVPSSLCLSFEKKEEEDLFYATAGARHKLEIFNHVMIEFALP